MKIQSYPQDHQRWLNEEFLTLEVTDELTNEHTIRTNNQSLNSAK